MKRAHRLPTCFFPYNFWYWKIAFEFSSLLSMEPFLRLLVTCFHWNCFWFFSTSSILDPDCRKKEDPQRSSPATLPDHPSNVNTGCFTSVELSPPGRTSPVIHSAISDSHLEQRPRQRRFGTVTPPEPSLIVHLNTNEKQLKSPKQSIIQHASSDPCSIVSASPPSDGSNTLPCIRIDGTSSLVAQNALLINGDSSGQNPSTYKDESTSRMSPSPCAVSMLAKPPSVLSPRALSHGLKSGAPQHHQFLPNLVGNIPSKLLALIHRSEFISWS